MKENQPRDIRRITAKVGDVLIGGGNPIIIQTMCNTHTCDIDASFDQCVRLARSGARIIRLTVQGMAEVGAIAQIKEKLRSQGIFVPLVADIHFRSDVALEAAKVVEKVRVNPGNFNKDHGRAREDFIKLMDICKEHDTAIRIGVNHGSLGERITAEYGNTPRGMAMAAMEWLRMCIDHKFFNVVVSLKASNVLVMVQAYRILQQMMVDCGIVFPTHLGVTEAGNGDAARIKSAVGISTLLSEGIGDTIRVSLTEDPEEEIPTAADIITACQMYKDVSMIPPKASWQEYSIAVACLFGPGLLDRKTDSIPYLDCPFGAEKEQYLKDEIMQATRRKFYRPEYIGCPGCGRTMFDLEKTFNLVKSRTGHLSDICIAVMGCIVNGPGEMADADFGYVGEGRSLVTIYKGKEPVYRHVPENEAIDKLLELISSKR